MAFFISSWLGFLLLGDFNHFVVFCFVPEVWAQKAKSHL